jgi:outer membrane protein assembly factor BamA
MIRAAAVVLLTLLAGATLCQAQVAEVLGEVRVHGNHTTPDADVLAIAGLMVGARVTESLLREATDRLRSSGRFDDVDVRKRYRSIEDPSDILVIILVDEVTAITAADLTPGPLKKFRSMGMWLPVIDYADGYGFTYGARVSFVNALGKRSRISVPLTWGGERRAAVEIDRTFQRGPFTRVEFAAAIFRKENPHFEIGDTRREARLGAERALTSWLRIGADAAVTNVRFADLEDTFVTPRAVITVDTRSDPAFPRNAVHVVAAIEQLRFDSGPRIGRSSLDARGYVGLFGSTVLALKAVSVHAGGALPVFEQALLGGVASLRGYDRGYRVGDSLAAMSAELRVPLTSPINMGKFGVKAFIDAGTVYASSAKLTDQPFDRGVGAGMFMTLAVIRMGLDVAWPLGQPDKTPHWHFGLGVTF